MPEFGRVVNVQEFDRPMLSDDIETGQTIELMDQLATRDASDPEVERATREALDQAGIDFNAAAIEIAQAVFWWLKRTVRYVPTPGTSPLVDQTLIAPCAVLAMPEPIGDCPQFSMLAAAMLRVCCIPTRYVTIKAEEKAPDLWSHVYITVEVLPGKFLPFDASNGPEPGAEYARPFARHIWPSGAKRSPCQTKETSQSMMRSTTHRKAPQGMRSFALRGAMGDVACDQDGNCYDTTTGELTSAPLTTGPGCDPGMGGCGTPNPYIMTGPNPTPAELNQPLAPIAQSTTSASGGILSTLLTDAAALGTSSIQAATRQQPTYITNPQTGQSVLYNPNTGQLVGAAAAAPLSSSNFLWIGLIAIAALAFAGRK